MTAAVRRKDAGSLRDELVALSVDTAEMGRSAALGGCIRQAREELISSQVARTSDGDKLSRALADLIDEAVQGLFAAGTALYKDEAAHLSVVAVGGYGRRRLAPFSDIDLLFLHSSRAGQKVKPLLDFVLYALWDAGLTVSQAVHTPSSAIDFVKEDIQGCTSYLDARPLAGNERLMSEFLTRYDKYRQQSGPAFIEAKLAERAERLAAGQNSRYLVEPDVKEGKGGLRDLETLHWLARYIYSTSSDEEMISKGIFSEEDLTAYQKALGFLWSIRFQLHMVKGRADEHLTFEVQPEIAKRLGYRSRGAARAVERLMKHYFLNAREVGRMTGVISAVLEEAQVKKSRFFESGLFGSARRRTPQVRPDEFGPADAFVLRGDRLDFTVSEAQLVQNPLLLLRLFRIAGRKPSCDIHPEAFQKAVNVIPSLSGKAVRTEDMATCFEKIILDTEDPEGTLRDMSEVGLLGTCLPAFAMLVGRVVYGLYRRYTVDEHVLKSVGVLTSIHRGDEDGYHPISAEIMAQTQNPLPFYLAVLMHETAYALPQPDQEKVERKIRNTLRPFIKDRRMLDDVVWVASHHKLLAHTATRRNIMETRTISRFASEVGTPERLDLLIVLTVSHLKVAGINSWDKWTRRDISVLYQATRAWFEGGELALKRDLKKRRDALRSKTARKLKDWPVPQLDRFFARLSDGFFEGVNPDAAARFARLLEGVDQSSSQGDAAVTLLEEGMVEVIVYSRDRPGLYANIAGAVAASGGTVRASAAFPIRPLGRGADMAANIFIFESPQALAFSDPQEKSRWLDDLHTQFIKAINTIDVSMVELPRHIGDRREEFHVPSKVTLDKITSEDCLIVEARGLDRPGLLNKLAACLSEIGASIRSAHVATYGELAVDTFYIQDMPGYKITDKRRQEVIRRRVLSVLNDH